MTGCEAGCHGVRSVEGGGDLAAEVFDALDIKPEDPHQ
jgi:hypothetical protein